MFDGADPTSNPVWARWLVPVYWAMVFLVFPLAMDYPALFSKSLATLPSDAMMFIPKAVALATCWATGIVLIVALGRGTHLSSFWRLVRGRSAWGWCVTALVLWIIFAGSLSHEQYVSPWLGSRQRYDGIVFEALWWSLVPITWSIARSTAYLGRQIVLVPAFAAAVIISAWTTLESYGFEPLSLLSAQVSRTGNNNSAASLGHQALVSIYLSVLALALSVWFARRDGRATMRRPFMQASVTVAMIAVLWTGAFGSGGRSGPYAAIVVWVLFMGWIFLRRTRQRPAVIRLTLVSAIIVIAGLAVGLTSRHVQAKTHATIAGGTSFAHRLITWRLGLEAVVRKPVLGYGPDDFARQVWKYATPSQERELLTEAVPRAYVASAKRTGDAVVYVDGNDQIHMLRINYDKTHNYLIELAFASGIPALLAFVLLLLSSAWELAHASDPAPRAMLWGLLVFFVAVQAWFYTLSLDPLIWAWLGVALGWASVTRLSTPADAIPEAGA